MHRAFTVCATGLRRLHQAVVSQLASRCWPVPLGVLSLFVGLADGLVVLSAWAGCRPWTT